jgi:hypothetical protein
MNEADRNSEVSSDESDGQGTSAEDPAKSGAVPSAGAQEPWGAPEGATGDREAGIPEAGEADTPDS